MGDVAINALREHPVLDRFTIAAACLVITMTACTPAVESRPTGQGVLDCQTSFNSAAPTNVQVSSGRYFGFAEPDAVENPRDRNNVVAAAQFEKAADVRVPGSFASFDAGRSWIEPGPLALPNGFVQGADTTVAFESDGTALISALVVASQGAGHASSVSSGAVLVWRSRNGGRSFDEPVIVYQSQGFQDHPWLATSASGEAYIAWTNAAGLQFSISGDEGLNWTSARLLVGGQAPLDPVVIAGTAVIHVVYESLAIGSIRLTSLDSTDDGHSFTAHDIGSVPEAHLPGSSATKEGSQIPLFGAAADKRGIQLSVAISSFPAGNGHPSVFLWSSSNGGASWSAPAPIATGAASAVAMTQPRPAITADGVSYVLALVTDRNGAIRPVVIAHHPNSPSFGRAQPVSSVCFASDQWLGDFQALAAGGGDLHALWNDGRSGRLEIESATLKVPSA